MVVSQCRSDRICLSGMAESELEWCRGGLCCWRSKLQSLFLLSGKVQSSKSVWWWLYCRALSPQSAEVLKAEAAWQCHLCHLCRLWLLGGLWAPCGVFTIPTLRYFAHCLCAERELGLHIPNFRAMQQQHRVVCALSRHLTNYCTHSGGEKKGKKNQPQFLVIQPPDAAAVAAGWNLL